MACRELTAQRWKAPRIASGIAFHGVVPQTVFGASNGAHLRLLTEGLFGWSRDRGVRKSGVGELIREENARIHSSPFHLSEVGGVRRETPRLPVLRGAQVSR